MSHISWSPEIFIQKIDSLKLWLNFEKFKVYMLRYIIHCKESSWHCTIPPKKERYGKYDLRKAKTRDN